MHLFCSISVLLITAVFQIVTATCPSPDTLSPCTCHDDEDGVDVVLYCTDGDTTLDQLKNALNVLKDKDRISLELEELNLGKVPSDFFRGLRIKMLEITQCNLDSLNGGDEKPLEGLEDILEELSISSSFTENSTPTKLVVNHLKNLRQLDLNYNSINELDDSWFKDAPSTLRRISISNNDILRIGQRAFADVKNLEFLALDGNRFGSISRSMLPNPAQELDKLELDNNGLYRLPEDIFTNMPYLTVLSLNNNGISSLPENIWKPIWDKVDEIDLRGNPLICDSKMDWMSQVPTCAVVSGTCMAPREKSGHDIPYLKAKRCSSRR